VREQRATGGLERDRYRALQRGPLGEQARLDPCRYRNKRGR
jgi:hypothetical protein